MKAASAKDLLRYEQAPCPPAFFTLAVCHLTSGTGQTITETRLVKRLGGVCDGGRQKSPSSLSQAFPRLPDINIKSPHHQDSS